MKAIVNAELLLPDGSVTGPALLFDTKILGLVDEAALPGDIERIDGRGGLAMPGLIDLHIHGYRGDDASDGSLGGIQRMSKALAEHGVTAYLPTTMTIPMPEIEAALQAIGEAMRMSNSDTWTGAKVLGANVEGPFINPARKGAQAEENILPADKDFILKHRDVIRMFTIAPEMPGNLEVIRQLAGSGVIMSIGHSSATYEEAKAAMDAGCSHVTHLFNAMTGLNHRQPGLVGAALTDERVSTELIADTFHVHPALYDLIWRMKGSELVLITDCLRAGGMPDGMYTLGGQDVRLTGIECRLMDGTIAGSVLTLERAVENFWRHTGLPLYEVAALASASPARTLGIDAEKGSLAPGHDADIALMTRDFQVFETISEGRTIYRRR